MRLIFILIFNFTFLIGFSQLPKQFTFSSKYLTSRGFKNVLDELDKKIPFEDESFGSHAGFFIPEIIRKYNIQKVVKYHQEISDNTISDICIYDSIGNVKIFARGVNKAFYDSIGFVERVVTQYDTNFYKYDSKGKLLQYMDDKNYEFHYIGELLSYYVIKNQSYTPDSIILKYDAIKRIDSIITRGRGNSLDIEKFYYDSLDRIIRIEYTSHDKIINRYDEITYNPNEILLKSYVENSLHTIYTWELGEANRILSFMYDRRPVVKRKTKKEKSNKDFKKNGQDHRILYRYEKIEYSYKNDKLISHTNTTLRQKNFFPRKSKTKYSYNEKGLIENIHYSKKGYSSNSIFVYTYSN